MNHLHAAIRGIEQEIESHYQSVAELEKNAAVLRKLCGLGPDDDLDADEEDKAPPTRRFRRPAKRSPRVTTRKARALKKRTDGRTDGRSKARAIVTSPRSLPNAADPHGILGALAGGPCSPGDLAKRLGFKALVNLRYHLKPLFASGQVVASGSTANRVIALAPAGYAETPETPQPRRQYTTRRMDTRVPAATSAAPAPSTPVEVVEGRDRRILDALAQSGRVGRSVRELAILGGDSEAAVEASVTRLRIKKLAACDDTQKWTAVG